MDWETYWTITLQVVVASIILRILAVTWGYGRRRPPFRAGTTYVYNSADEA